MLSSAYFYYYENVYKNESRRWTKVRETLNHCPAELIFKDTRKYTSTNLLRNKVALRKGGWSIRREHREELSLLHWAGSTKLDKICTPSDLRWKHLKKVNEFLNDRSRLRQRRKRYALTLMRVFFTVPPTSENCKNISNIRELELEISCVHYTRARSRVILTSVRKLGVQVRQKPFLFKPLIWPFRFLDHGAGNSKAWKTQYSLRDMTDRIVVLLPVHRNQRVIARTTWCEYYTLDATSNWQIVWTVAYSLVRRTSWVHMFLLYVDLNQPTADRRDTESASHSW